MSQTRRITAALCTGAALINAAMAAASATSTIVAGDRLGAGWGAVPNTAGIVGSGLGALGLTWLMRRWNRRAPLTLAYVVAVLGSCLAVASVAAGDVAGLSAGMLLLGVGNAAALLSRYVVADLYPLVRRGRAIGVVVWSATIGAVGGPLLMHPSASVVTGFGWVAMTGPFLLAGVACALAAAATIGALAAGPGASGSGSPAAAESEQEGLGLRVLARTPVARSALVVMVTAQVVMVAVMTATPMDMHLHGLGMGAVGLVLAAHTFGMFALSPVTGRLVDRYGPAPVMRAGLLTLVVASALVALVPDARLAALFLLGYGWNLGFVGGSARLARDLPEPLRPQVEGRVDAAVWGLAALASLVSTPVLDGGGQVSLAAGAGVLALGVALWPAVRKLRPAVQDGEPSARDGAPAVQDGEPAAPAPGESAGAAGSIR